ncbi:Outer membrane protein beta-barrel domain-containing protein [Cyclobacterium xiamenense]|uniref:Outer membrane protein beta-barrel domain-containing protein n=1 Tax=Cyclobacterium xiamenense TaxID=1297121 RepID=A0A1H6Y7G3_9BACT|nr:outer membrane beta-barrel protein [Cyclobacterium xiamenense]SEJ33060.1 Outer membrane protein beta-barrel domain-containing protein [Cyclobacterium xiamenense]
MKEQFDKKLVEKIKASFSSHEEPFDPQAWEKFSKAYFKPKKSGRWLVLWPFLGAGIAASLLFFFLYYPEQAIIEEKVRALTDSISIEDPLFSEENSQAVIDSTAPTSSSEKPAENGQQGPALALAPTAIPARKGSPESNDKRKVEAVPETDAGDPGFWSMAFGDAWADFQAVVTEKVASDFLFESIPQTEQKEGISESEAQQMVDRWKTAEEVPEANEVPTESRAVKVGLMVSPQANSNPVSGMNLGAGLMSEISLTKRLKLDVGLAYASQRVSPQNFQPLRQHASPSFDARTNSNIIDTDYQLNFASLDIPVNLKYKVFDKKQTGIYLITGLSSMVYLEQNTVETVQTQSLFTANSMSGTLEYAPNVQQFSTINTPASDQSNADLAGLLNISFGYEYKLNNEFYFSLEPFYKLPLSNLTFANQQFSIGGVNLRMNFNLKNK